jgi:hypothetical protein
MFSDETKVIGLEAISLGYAVPRRDFDANVHSVFSEAANLQSGKGRLLLTLVTAECADLPQGIRLEAPPAFSFEKELHPGDRMVCRNSLLRDEQGRLSIDLRHARRWRCKLPDLDADEIAPPVAAAWISVWQALDERQRRTGTQIRAAELFRTDLPGRTAVARKMGALIRELVDAARRLVPPVGASVAGLIGLGPGLTPSGDDFLVGFLTGLRCMIDKKEERLAFLSDLGKTVVCLSCQTNDISRIYLYHAVRGQVSSRLVALAKAIARGEDSSHLLQTAEDAMQVGHSSGMETVTGLLVGLSAWGNGLPPV